ncbi:MAG: alpha/beta fold hydrolase [Desulfobacterales bacterium]|nr:alpha/beta fold hydrolase [Desulfobacterales bacterium]
MSFFTTPDNCRIFFKLTGSDSPLRTIVFLNGLSQTTLYWHPFARKLASRYRILCYDARAQGQSDIGHLPLTLENHAQDLLLLMDHLDIHQAVLVGLSHGAYVACAVAAATPQRTAGIVLSGAADAPSDNRLGALRQWQAALAIGGLSDLARKFIESAFGNAFIARHHHLLPAMEKTLAMRNRSDALVAQFTALHHYPPLSTFTGKINTPAMVMWGDQDRLVSQDGAHGLARRLGATWVPLPGIGHSLPVEAPEAFNRHLGEFLAGLDT